MVNLLKLNFIGITKLVIVDCSFSKYMVQEIRGIVQLHICG